MWREDLKGCFLYNSKPLEYQRKGTVQEEAIYRGLEGLQLSLRGFILLLVLIVVYDTWTMMMIKFSIDLSIFV